MKDKQPKRVLNFLITTIIERFNHQSLVKEHHAQHEIDDEYRHQRNNHGCGGTFPDAFSAANGRRPPPAGNDRDDRAERHALGGHDADIAQL